MSSHSSISPENLAPLVGTQRAPSIVDVRPEDDFKKSPLLIPGSVRRDALSVQSWGPAFARRTLVVSCSDGGGLSQGTSAWLRNTGVQALTLDGGFSAWRSAGNLLTNAAAIPPRDASGRSVWVTRERPKIDRIACPWLIRRFVDPDAAFLFVEATRVSSVAAHFDATPFDVEGVFWSHRGETCTFDTMLAEFELESPALHRLALIVRGADTARLDLAPQASGFLAASLGLSRLFDDDLAQLDAGMTFYDAMYLWCRDASMETHNWPSKIGPPPTSK
jgi:rhodanese-related sulfurtransferase